MLHINEGASGHRHSRVVSWFRRNVKPLLGEYKYLILFISATLVAVMGYVGFSILYPTESFLNKAYLTLQLFTLSSGRYAGPPILCLDIARVLAPFIIYISLIAVVADHFYYHLELFWLRHITRNHTVICGLGYVGSMVVRNPRVAAESAVVVIEKSPTHKEIDWCKKHGIVVIIGDATEMQTLIQANVKDAEFVYVATGDDDTNANVIAQLNKIAGMRRHPIKCFAHIKDPGYANLLQSVQLPVNATTSIRLEFFNLYQVLSNCVVDSVHEFNPSKASSSADVQIMVVGLGRMGESIIVQVVKRWKRRFDGRPPRRVNIVVIDRDAKQKVAMLEARYPSLVEYCEIDPHEMDLKSPAFVLWQPLEHLDPSRLKAVFLCLTDESLNFSVALRLNHALQGLQVPIIVRTVQSKGFAHFFNEVCSKHDDDLKNIRAFPLVSCSCCVDSLIGINETIARSLHNRYLLHRRREGSFSEDDPALKPWTDLDVEYKDANREQAVHIVLALKNIGYYIVPQADWDQAMPSLSYNEVEKLAILEHTRWVNDRLGRGWKPGPRDLEKKTSPYLGPWEELDEKIREYDRIFVRDYPSMLAAVDLTMLKTP